MSCAALAAAMMRIISLRQLIAGTSYAAYFMEFETLHGIRGNLKSTAEIIITIYTCDWIIIRTLLNYGQ